MANVAPQRTVRSAIHICRILDCFSAETPVLNLTAVAQAIGLRPSSTHRLLQTLVLHGYLTFDKAHRRYRLGERIGRLVAAYGESTLGEIARAVLERLRDVTGETAAVQVRAGDVRYCVAEVPSAQPIRLTLTEMARYPVRRGAAGAILRAFAPAWRDENDQAALRRIRADGYAISRGALFPGAVAIYVPLYAAGGTLVAALGVHGLAFRIADRDLRSIVAHLQAASGELSPAISADVKLR